tara:strand:+ start:225 stop:449 length:225 start_codon:yes stop_codon:yes gene_type:complete
MENAKILDYALNFLLANIDETTEEDLGMTTEEIEKGIEYVKGNGGEEDKTIKVSSQAGASSISITLLFPKVELI